MGFREHILYLAARIHIPLRNVMLTHGFFGTLGEALFRDYTLSRFLHYVKRHTRVKPCVHKVNHNAVTRSDNRRNGAYTILYKVLCITVPNIGSV